MDGVSKGNARAKRPSVKSAAVFARRETSVKMASGIVRRVFFSFFSFQHARTGLTHRGKIRKNQKSAETINLKTESPSKMDWNNSFSNRFERERPTPTAVVTNETVVIVELTPNRH